MSHKPMQPAAVLMSARGRAGVVLPLDVLVNIAGFAMTLIICAICLVIWGFTAIWHPLCWSVTAGAIIFGVRKHRKGRK